VKSTRRGFKVRRLHNDFLARFWGRGKNRTKITYELQEQQEYNGSQIDIMQASNEITYALQEGKTQRSQIDIMQTLKEITYALQEGGERSVRSTFCSHQKRSRTTCRRGGECSSQIDIMQTSNEITYGHQWLPLYIIYSRQMPAQAFVSSQDIQRYEILWQLY
jgi:response regulator of citrate/malate metabolism